MDENMENPTPSPDDQPQQAPQATEMPQEAPPPPISDNSKDDKMWGMFCHLAALAGFVGIPFGNILGPLILWLIKKDEIAFVNDQGKEALNFQISLTIYFVAILPTLCFFPLWILLTLALSIANVVFIILASIAANKGQAYRYPCCIRLIK